MARSQSTECRQRIEKAMSTDEAGLVRRSIQRRGLEPGPRDGGRSVRARVGEAPSSSAGPMESEGPAGEIVPIEGMEVPGLCLKLSALGEGEVHISELFGPGRFTSRASAFNLVPGMAYDLRVGFDLNVGRDRVRVMQKIKGEDRWLFVGSLKCSRSGTSMALDSETGKVRAVLQDGLQHLVTMCEVYKNRWKRGKFFLNEHPKTAPSWSLWMIQEVLGLQGDVCVENDQCAFGLWCTDDVGPAFVCTPTRWVTDSPAISARLNRSCSNARGGAVHRHRDVMQLSSNGRRVMERYPVGLVKAVLKGLREQLILVGALGALEAGPRVDEPDPWNAHPEYDQEIYDVASGTRLDPELVAKARAADMDFLQRDLGAWSYSTIDECMRITGRRPIPMTWADINKGDSEKPNVRSRLCCA